MGRAYGRGLRFVEWRAEEVPMNQDMIRYIESFPDFQSLLVHLGKQAAAEVGPRPILEAAARKQMLHKLGVEEIIDNLTPEQLAELQKRSQRRRKIVKTTWVCGAGTITSNGLSSSGIM